MGDGHAAAQNNTALCCEEITFKISLKECKEQQSNSVSTVTVFNLSVNARMHVTWPRAPRTFSSAMRD